MKTLYLLNAIYELQMLFELHQILSIYSSNLHLQIVVIIL